MGIRDQFQDKANRLEAARKAMESQGREAPDQTSKSAPDAQQRGRQQRDEVRDEFDDRS